MIVIKKQLLLWWWSRPLCRSVPLCLTGHLLNLLLAQLTIVTLFFRRDIQDTIDIYTEADSELGNTSGSRRDSIKRKLPEQIVAFANRSVAVKDRKRTLAWLSEAMVSFRLFVVGIGIFIGITTDTSPRMSTPRDSGVTSITRKSGTLWFSWLLKIAAWTAGPMATASPREDECSCRASSR